MRKHGFNWPPDSHQVIAVLLFSLLVSVITLFLGVLTARIDAGDPGIRHQHVAELTVSSQQPKFVCTICKVVPAGCGTHSEHGGRTSERGMRRSRQENMLSSRPTTTGGDVSQSQELTNRQLIPAGYTAPSSRPTTAGDNGGQSQEPSEQQVIPAGMSISSSDTASGSPRI
ncbi:hypothetical protein WJX84_005884 [Apatococcus fuscideae]|uniref:Secreted protein n=1 Tax=Apatococcus fuscideae TaxID=2026836 RepID=A0AAW1T555_9CHLO